MDKKGIKLLMDKWIIDGSSWKMDSKNIVHVKGSVKIKPTMDLKTTGTLPFKFGEITGNFTATCCFLRNLVNFPDEIGGDIDVSHNNLKTLKGFPKVTGNVNVSFNKNIDFNGIQEEINGDFHCSACDLVHLNFSPTRVKGSYFADGNSLKTFSSKIELIGVDLVLNDNYFSSDVSITKDKIKGRIELHGNPMNPDDEFDKSMW